MKQETRSREQRAERKAKRKAKRKMLTNLIIHTRVASAMRTRAAITIFDTHPVFLNVVRVRSRGERREQRAESREMRDER
jgi:hypothetical protein